MNNFVLVSVIVSSVLIVFILLFLGKYHHIKSQIKHIGHIWSKLLIQIQYYCDNVPYTLEAYKLLNPTDNERFAKILNAKIDCIKSMKDPLTLNKSFKELLLNLDNLFDLRKNDTKIAHDLRFIEAFSEFKTMYASIAKLAEHYNRDKVKYESTLNKGFGRLAAKVFKFPEIVNFEVK